MDEIIQIEAITDKIYSIRGKRVIPRLSSIPVNIEGRAGYGPGKVVWWEIRWCSAETGGEDVG